MRPSKLVIMLDIVVRYAKLVLHTFVDDNEYLKWCPAPNCEHVVECHIPSSSFNQIVPSVQCNCGNRFCYSCSLPDHLPAPCFLVKRWLQKCKDDSETANWISANTKECSKCQATIEKNGGCNHMTCKKCKHEFCWVCLGPWTEHGTQWYNCNRYEEKSGSEARDQQTKSRAQLERYLHVRTIPDAILYV
jgi:ariadne-1